MKLTDVLAVALVMLVAGCTSQTTQPTAPAGPSAGPGTEIAKAADVPPGATYEFTYNGERAILVNFNGLYAAYVNVCPHKKGPNKLEGDSVVCTLHGSQFNPETGKVTKGPATTDLTKIEVETRGGSVYAK